jgi:hypothetical protein
MLVTGGVVALLMMLGRGAMRFRGALVMLSRFVMRLIGHVSSLLCSRLLRAHGMNGGLRPGVAV